MMKLHAKVIYTCILCVLLKIGEVWCNCCWIVDEFMINWCCCCCFCCGFMLWVFMIMEFVVRFEWFLKVLWKMGEFGDLWWNDVFDPSFIWFWVSFYVCKRLDKLWGWIWVLENQNWGFGAKMGFFPESIVVEHCHNSPWRIAQWHHSMFHVLASFSHISVLNWPLV